MTFLNRKKSSCSSSSSISSNNNSSSSFSKFDEKKDYARRCSIKNQCNSKKHCPPSVSFCLNK